MKLRIFRSPIGIAMLLLIPDAVAVTIVVNVFD